MILMVSEGDVGTAKGEPPHQRSPRWGRGAVCMASWTWSEVALCSDKITDRRPARSYPTTGRTGFRRSHVYSGRSGAVGSSIATEHEMAAAGGLSQVQGDRVV